MAVAGLCAACAAPNPADGSPQGQPTTTSVADDAAGASTACVAPSRYIFGPDRAPDYSSETLFTISELSGNKNGQSLVRYNADTPQPGSDGQGSPSRIAEVLPDGSVNVLTDVTVGQRTVAVSNLYPLLAAPQGGQYLYDRSNGGILLRNADAEWSQIATLPEGSVFKVPSLALGVDNSIFVATGSQVLQLSEDGDLQAIAGKAVRAADILFPQTPLVGLPLPALEIELPSTTAMIVDGEGIIFIATADTVYSIADGLLRIVHVVGTTVQPPGEAVDPPNITGLAIDVDGSLIVSDSANQLVYSIQNGSSKLLAVNTRFISDGSVLSRPNSAPLLRVDGNQEAVCTL